MGIYSPDTRIHALNQDQDSKQHMPLDNANVVLLVSQNRHFVTTFRTQYERDGDRHGALWERILPGSGEVDDRKAYCRQKFDSACKRRDELLAQMATRYVPWNHTHMRSASGGAALQLKVVKKARVIDLFARLARALLAPFRKRMGT